MSASSSTARPAARRTYGKRSQPGARPTTYPLDASNPPTSAAYGLAPQPLGYVESFSSPSSSPSNLSGVPSFEQDCCGEAESASSAAPSSPTSALQDLVGSGNMMEQKEASTRDEGARISKEEGNAPSPYLSKRPLATAISTKHKQISLNSFFHRQAGSSPAAASSSSSVSRSSSDVHGESTAGPSAPASTSSDASLRSRPAGPKSLTQLHLLPIRFATTPSPASSRYTTCAICQMTYLPSGLGGEDERIHAKHCERVKEGVVWNTGCMDGEGGGSGGVEAKGQLKMNRDPGSVVERDVRVERNRKKAGDGGVVSGNVVCVDGREAVSGNSKLLEILSSVDTVLSAPSLPDQMLDRCKIFLFVTSSPAPAAPLLVTARSAFSSFGVANGSTSANEMDATDRVGPSHKPAKRLKPEEFKALADVARARERGASKSIGNGRVKIGKMGKERVVAVLVVQPIRWAMRVLSDEEKRLMAVPVESSGDADMGSKKDDGRTDGLDTDDEARPDIGVSAADKKRKRSKDDLVVACESETGNVTSGGGVGAVICDPERLPTKLGAHRIFTIPAYRGLGISKVLLDAACEHTTHGRKCDASHGDVAFSQPTSSGRAVMEAWGKGHVRVFVEDEQE